MKPTYENLPTTSTAKQIADQKACEEALQKFFANTNNPSIVRGETPKVFHLIPVSSVKTEKHIEKNVFLFLGLGGLLGIILFLTWVAWGNRRKKVTPKAITTTSPVAEPPTPLSPEGPKAVAEQIFSVPATERPHDVHPGIPPAPL